MGKCKPYEPVLALLHRAHSFYVATQDATYLGVCSPRGGDSFAAPVGY